MADCTYANVLADSLGLSPLTTDPQIEAHLQAVLAENDTPYGFLVQTGRYGSLLKNGSLGPGMRANGDQDNSLWMMANPNWATLSIWRNGDPNKALAVADKSLNWWRSHLKDMWNVVAVGGGLESTDRGGQPSEGQPMANSHYGYHMVMW